MDYKPYIIYVSGDLISQEGRQYAQSFTAGAISSVEGPEIEIGEYQEAVHSVNGNYVFDKHHRAVPYALYCSIGGTRADKGADLSSNPGFGPAYSYYADSIKKLRGLLEEPISQKAQDAYYMGLYVETFGALELFLCDYLLCGIFSDQVYFNNAIKYLDEEKIKYKKEPISIENIIHIQISRKVYHQFDKIKGTYKRILEVDFPDCKELKALLRKRHNIVHRFAVSSYDWMTLTVASKENVSHLLDVVDVFVKSLMESGRRTRIE